MKHLFKRFGQFVRLHVMTEEDNPAGLVCFADIRQNIIIEAIEKT